MSFQLMAWAAEQRTGSATRKAVLMALANAANHHSGQCNPSVARLAEETELGERAVRTALAELAKSGLISRERSRRGDGSLGTYWYGFPMQAGATPAAAGAGGPAAPGAALEEEPGTTEPGTTADAVAVDDSKAPKLVRIAGRDLAMDSLARVCGIDPSGGRARELATALNGPTGIRAQAWREMQAGRIGPRADPGEPWERLLAGSIATRAEQYRRKMPPGSMLTATALAKWWSDLPSMEAGTATASAQEIFDAAARELERE